MNGRGRCGGNELVLGDGEIGGFGKANFAWRIEITGGGATAGQ